MRPEHAHPGRHRLRHHPHSHCHSVRQHDRPQSRCRSLPESPIHCGISANSTAHDDRSYSYALRRCPHLHRLRRVSSHYRCYHSPTSPPPNQHDDGHDVRPPLPSQPRCRDTRDSFGHHRLPYCDRAYHHDCHHLLLLLLPRDRSGDANAASHRRHSAGTRVAIRTLGRCTYSSRAVICGWCRIAVSLVA